jgi:uncharacterized protein YlxW (UPF0749 family)
MNFLQEAQEDFTTGMVANLTDEAWVLHTQLNELIEQNEQLKDLVRQALNCADHVHSMTVKEIERELQKL